MPIKEKTIFYPCSHHWYVFGITSPKNDIREEESELFESKLLKAFIKQLSMCMHTINLTNGNIFSFTSGKCQFKASCCIYLTHLTSSSYL